MERKEVTLNDKILDVLVMMAEGNVGACSVINAIMSNYITDGFVIILHLDDMNIRGEQIWIGYKYFCEQDLGKFVQCVFARDEGMVRKINEMSQCGWVAVHHGASSGKRQKKAS